ncbi:MAG: phosphoglycerate kinase [Candidatus Paceibacterota bacterium]|jgi:phosphoglycerate kinase
MIKYLSKTDKNKLKGTAVVRLDFNTEDDWRMKAALPTLKFLIKAGVKVLILSHRGRPQEGGKSQIANRKANDKLSLRKDVGILGRLLKKKIGFISGFDFKEIRETLKKASEGSVFLLENLRFLPGEEKNSKKLAKDLAKLGNFYVNDAFAVSHRANASMAAITKFLPSYAGLGLEEELKHLAKVVNNPIRPLVLLVGGGKAKDKVEVLKNLEKKADALILGGAVANTILFLQGRDIGDSVVDRKDNKIFMPIINFKNLILPVDFKYSGKKILDIGPQTIRVFSDAIKGAGTVVWNGPLGLIEDNRFREGSLAMARAITKNRKCFSLVGGGETVMFLKKYKLDKKFSFVSTGGGAMLDFFAGKKLPGLIALGIEKQR